MKWQKRKRTYFLGEIGYPVASIYPVMTHVAPFGWEEETGKLRIDILGSEWKIVELTTEEAMEEARQELKQRAYALLDIAANAAGNDWEHWTP